MLTSKQIEEIREHLEKAQNPIFYYDNDADGLCSYIILRKFLDRGKGVAVRSFPSLDKDYARKARELGSDYVFVLDKPLLSKEFVEAIGEIGLPLVWIDHHDMPIENYEISENFFVYNPARNYGKDKSSEPTTYLSYKIADKKLKHVYIGNIQIPGGEDTLCPKCKAVCIKRSRYTIQANKLENENHCPQCGYPLHLVG